MRKLCGYGSGEKSGWLPGTILVSMAGAAATVCQAQTMTLHYDNANHLIGATSAGSDVQFNYDANGNLVGGAASSSTTSIVGTAQTGRPRLSNIAKPAALSALAGNYANSSKVPATTGNRAVSSVTSPVAVCNRKAGSGNKVATSVHLPGGTQCMPANSVMAQTNGAANSYSAGDDLARANSTTDTVKYAGISQAANVGAGSAYPNKVTLLQLSGTASADLGSAVGQYDWWHEATLNPTSNIPQLPFPLHTRDQRRLTRASMPAPMPIPVHPL